MREIRLTLPPNGEQQIQARGDFVFVDYIDREIRLMIKDEIISVNSGDKIRPARAFESLSVINPDSVNPVAVVLKVGEGDYNSQIIRGEIVVSQGVRKSDGVFVSDTRSDLELSVNIRPIEPREYTAGDFSLSRVAPDLLGKRASGGFVSLGKNRFLLKQVNSGGTFNGWGLIEDIEKSAEIVPVTGIDGTGSGNTVGNEFYLLNHKNFPIVGNCFYISVYDKETLNKKYEIQTEVDYKPNGSSWVHYIEEKEAFVFWGNSNSGTIHFVNKSGKKIAPSIHGGTNYGRTGTVLHGGFFHCMLNRFSNGSGLVMIDAQTFQQAADDEYRLPSVDIHPNSILRVGSGVYMGLTIGGTGDDMKKLELRDVKISAAGSVASCESAAMFKPSDIKTEAQIFTQRQASGRVMVSGEIIRAVLEIYADKPMPDDYLDYIYKVEAEEINGIKPRTISSGAVSFKSAGIKDDAAATFPQKITITLREGLI